MPTVGTTPFYNEIILSYTIAFYGLLQYNLQKYKIFVVDLSQYKMKKRHNSLLYNLLCRY